MIHLTFSKKELAKIDVSTWGFIENLDPVGALFAKEVNAGLRDQFEEPSLYGPTIEIDTWHRSDSIVVELPLGASSDTNPKAKVKILDLVKDFMEHMNDMDEESKEICIKTLRTTLQKSLKLLDGK